jgi:hypothetical protein
VTGAGGGLSIEGCADLPRDSIVSGVGAPKASMFATF